MEPAATDKNENGKGGGVESPQDIEGDDTFHIITSRRVSEHDTGTRPQ